MTAPTPPPSIATPAYRGDIYRVNFTAGWLLYALSREKAPVPLATLIERLVTLNQMGVPGGKAGEQWKPPINPDFPDTMRSTCQRFITESDGFNAIVDSLHYSKLITFAPTGNEEVLITKVGREVVLKAEAQEANSRKDNPLTESVAYMSPDARDTAAELLPPDIASGVFSFGITQATAMSYSYQAELHDIAQANTNKLVPKGPSPAKVTSFALAINEGLTRPYLIVDPYTGQKKLDQELPLRRTQIRKPTYRQFLWSVFSDPRTVLLTLVGHTEEAVEMVASGNVIESPKNALEEEITHYRNVLASVQNVAGIVLRGGPEAIWVGKPLDPKDVHNEITGFTMSNRPGFSPKLIEDSSLAWEMYGNLKVSLNDLEASRQILSNINEKLVNLAPKDKDGMPAPNYVIHTADQLLRDLGIQDIPYTMQELDKRGYSNYICKIPQCQGRAVGGGMYCERHGGTYLSSEETESLARAMQQKIFGSANKSIETVIELMLHSSNDAVRLRAAEQLLNRAGFSETKDISVTLSASLSTEEKEESSYSIIMERLSSLSGAKQPPTELQAIEGEVIESELDLRESFGGDGQETIVLEPETNHHPPQ